MNIELRKLFRAGGIFVQNYKAFAGKLEQNTFDLNTTTRQRNLFMPKVTGYIISDGDGTQINLLMRPFNYNFFVAMLIPFLMLITFNFSIIKSWNSPFIGKLLVIVLPITLVYYIILCFNFHNAAKDIKCFFMELLEATESEETQNT